MANMRVLLVTSVRDEGPYLLEWIAHHRAAGVTDFLVYSNDCEDGTDAILNALDRAGIVTHVPQQREGGKSVQWQALKSAWKHPLRKVADWVLVSDVDEFLNIHAEGHDLSGLLAALPGDVDGVVIPWRLFGSNDRIEIEDLATTQQFTRAIPPDVQFPVAASFFKTLFRTSGPFNMLGVHRPRQKAEDKHGLPKLVDGAGRAFPEAFLRNEKRLSLWGMPPGRALVEMNHYSVRSAAAFLVKTGRGLPNRTSKQVDLGYWVERNYNQVEDRSIDVMRPGTEVELQALLQVPDVADLHLKAVGWHKARFAQMLRDADNHQLLTEILSAGGSVALSKSLQQQLVKWYQLTQGAS
ncbi:glycosyltransferase family 2 protein [Shimia biformata]|uniref:glycosyltransferase family 2 protein n=1 Tax=Shimia biformata TaxID=1294299 RepID=UPI0019512115|nr:glycosyltransferase family 2 protein [Shimia biformata]